MSPLDSSELYTGFSPIRASHVKQFFDLLTGITTDQAVSLKLGLSVTGGLTVVTGGLTVSAGTTTLAELLDISGASAGQIKFPASQNASSNANTLDDYEEGTWTGTIVGTTTPGAHTYTSQLGEYQKIGSRVFASCDIRINVKDAAMAGANVTISGFPIAAVAGRFFYGAAGWLSVVNLAAGYSWLGGQIGNTGTTALLLQNGDNVAYTGSVPADWANGSSIGFQVFYVAAN